MQKLLPPIRIENFTKFVTSKEMATIATAIAFTPAILGIVERLRKRFPLLRDHITASLIVAAFVLVMIAFWLAPHDSYLRAAILGLAGGTFITAILPYFDDTLRSLGVS